MCYDECYEVLDAFLSFRRELGRRPEPGLTEELFDFLLRYLPGEVSPVHLENFSELVYESVRGFVQGALVSCKLRHGNPEAIGELPLAPASRLADRLEAAQVEQIRIMSGTTSVESAVSRLDGLSGQALKDELARIQADKQSSMAAEPETRLDLGEWPEAE